MYYFYKFGREFFKLFGKNSKLYKKFQKAVTNHPQININYELKNVIEPDLQYISDVNAYFLAYTHFKQHYGIEIPTEVACYGNKFEYVRIKIKDIKRSWDGKLYSLKQCSPYKYLETDDKQVYEKYIQKHVSRNLCSTNTVWNVADFKKLFESIQKNGYDPTKSVICVTDNNIIIDGQHRSCCLLYLYGEDYEINVIKVTRKNV